VLLYVATIGAIALVARSLWLGPPPLLLACVALAAYVALVTCGVLFLGLGMFADVVTRGPDDSGAVALTFDDGPSPEHTPKILTLLDSARIKATFFVIGRKAEAHPQIIRAIKARGHAIGLHSYAHHRLFSLRSLRYVRADLERGRKAIEAITGEPPILFRPPIGHMSPRIAKAVDELGLVVVGWSIRALDGIAGARPTEVAERVTSRLEPGAIVLLHDAAERDDRTPASVEALPAILEAMKREGLKGVRVDAWALADEAEEARGGDNDGDRPKA
jgi:peptidoglycan/xylan/chitin deacetylase (PgdA/CDA1 family)